MNKTILLLLCASVFSFSLQAHEETQHSDNAFEGLTERELIIELLHSVEGIGRQLSELRTQVEVTKKEVFEKHGLHVIRFGDTFERLAIYYHLELDDLIELNPEVDPKNPRIGQVVRVKKDTENQSAHTTPASAPR